MIFNRYFFPLAFFAFMALGLIDAYAQSPSIEGNTLRSTVSGTVIKTEALNNSYRDLDQIAGVKKRTLVLNFNTGNDHALALENPAGTIVWDASLDLVVIGKDATGSEIKRFPISLLLNQHKPERVLLLEFTELVQITSFDVILDQYSTVSDGTYSNSQLDQLLRLDIFTEDELLFDVRNKSSRFLAISGQQVNAFVPCLPEELSKVTFSWQLPGTGMFVPSWDFQLLKVESSADGSYTLDWSKALTIEIPGQKELDQKYALTLAEGSGYYFWRVRPVGNFHEGGRANVNNYGDWSIAGYENSLFTTEGLIPATPLKPINPSTGVQAVTGHYFHYNQFNNQLNWSYNRVFTEEGKQAEKITYANGLNQVEQVQTRLSSSGEVVAAETVYDYSGRPALQTLPAPVQKSQLGYKQDFFSYSAADFDGSTTLYSPTIKQPEPGTVTGYYSSKNLYGEKGAYVPDSKGYPFSRTLYYNDATGRVMKQSGPGETMRLKDADPLNGDQSRNIFTGYAAATNDELIRIFGDEAPDSTTVYKVITSDPNKISSVQYVSQTGQVLATCLSGSSNSMTTLLDVGNEIPAGFPVKDYFPAGVVDKEGMVSTSSRTVLVEQETVVTLDYKIKPKTFNISCLTDICQECDYRIELAVSCPQFPDSPAKNFKMTYKLQPNDLKTCLNSTTQYISLGSVPLHEMTYTNAAGLSETRPAQTSITLTQGTYIIKKSIFTNNAFGNNTFLQERKELLKERSNSWDGSSNGCCEAFSPDVSSFDCGGVAFFCSGADPNLETLNDKYSAFLEIFAKAIEKEQGIVKDVTGKFMFRDLAYKNKMIDAGKFLFSNYFISGDAVNTTLLDQFLKDLLLENTINCQQIHDCFLVASANLDRNSLISQNPGATASGSGFGSDGFPNQEGSFSYDVNFDFVQAFTACLGKQYGFKAEFFKENHLPLYWSPEKERIYPDFTRTFSQVAFYDGSTGPLGTDNFDSQWTGFIDIPETGNYTFYAVVDDELRFWIDDNISAHLPEHIGAGYIQTIGTYSLTKGKHKLIMKHRDKGGAGELKLLWSASGISKPIAQQVIPFRYLLQPGTECLDKDAVVVYKFGEAVPGTDITKLYVPLSHQNGGSDASHRNRVCVASYFSDFILADNISSTGQTLSKPLPGLTVKEASAEVCACVNEYAYTDAPASPAVTEEEMNVRFQEECREECENNREAFALSIQTAVNNYNAANNVFSMDQQPAGSWKNFSDVFVGQDSVCVLNRMVNQCKSQCRLDVLGSIDRSLLDDATDFSTSFISPSGTIYTNYAAYIKSYEFQKFIMLEREEFNQALLQGLSVAPLGTYSAGGTEQEVKNEIIQFIYENWEKGLKYRVHNGIKSSTSTQKDLSPLNTNTVEDGNYYFQAVKEVVLNTGAATEPYQMMELVVNVVWDPLRNEIEDDVIKEVNFYLTCGSQKPVYFALNKTLCDFPDMNSHLFNIKEYVDVFFDDMGYMHGVVNTACGEAADRLQVTDNKFPGYFTLDVTGLKTDGTVPEAGNFFFLSLTDGTSELYLSDENINWAGSASATAQNIAVAINNTGRYFARVDNGITNRVYISLLPNSGIINPKSLVLSNAGNLAFSPGITNGIQFHLPYYNGTEGKSILELFQVGCTAVTSSLVCPYGYEKSPPVYDKLKYDHALPKAFSSEIIHLIYDLTEEGMKYQNPGTSPDYTFSGSRSVLVAGYQHKVHVEMYFYNNEVRMWSFDITIEGCTNVADFKLWSYQPEGTDVVPSGSIWAIKNNLPADFSTESHLLTIELRQDGILIVKGINDAALSTNQSSLGYIFYGSIKSIEGLYQDRKFLSTLNNGAEACLPNYTDPCEVCLKWEPLPGEDELMSGEEPVEVFSCESLKEEYIANELDHFIAGCLNRKYDELEEAYQTCLDQIDDHFSISYNLFYHHYTLYYYDRADNLMRTVPPQGVDFCSSLEIETIKKNRISGIFQGIYPEHKMETYYTYNSIKQLIKQQTPDGGITEFWYNAAGQLILSQNAAQKAKLNGTYSYTRYDHLGRPVEVGELSGFTPTFADPVEKQIINEIWQNPAFPGNSYTKNDEVYTTYSVADPNISVNGSGQMHLRNRISRTLTSEGVITSFSYDPHGNVEWLVQDLPEIGKKTIRYEYDLISGNVKKLYFNENTAEQFIHKFDYDADNRISKVFTSKDGILWDTEASYNYYLHGPLSRIEIGEDNIQGIDYAYSIEGYIKAVNQAELDEFKDAGRDGAGNGFLADEFGMELGYYNGDYDRKGTFIGNDNAAIHPFGASSKYSGRSDLNLYNGNISYWMSNTRIGNIGKTESPTGVENPIALKTNVYQYDKLNRLRNADFMKFEAGVWTEGTNTSHWYDETFTYDFNGNIKTATRRGHSGYGGDQLIDDLVYNYHSEHNNQLNGLTEKSTSPFTTDPYEPDLKPQLDIENYWYDDIGNLVEDKSEGVRIEWTVQGKVQSVTKTIGNDAPYTLNFVYDAMGNRVVKKKIKDGLEQAATYYVRDASGQLVAAYSKDFMGGKTTYSLDELPIYGSQRIGEYRPDLEVIAYATYMDQDAHALTRSSESELIKFLVPSGNGAKVVDLSLSASGTGSCGNTIISDITVSGDQTVNCSDEIVLSNTVVDGTGNLSVRSSTMVTLSPGFHALLGSEFSAKSASASDAEIFVLGTEVTNPVKNTATLLNETDQFLLSSYLPDQASAAHVILDKGLKQITVPSGISLAGVRNPINASPVFVKNPATNGRYFYLWQPETGNNVFRVLKYIELDVTEEAKVVSESAQDVSVENLGFPVVNVQYADDRSRLYVHQVVNSYLRVFSIDVTENGFEAAQERAAVNCSADNIVIGPGSDLAISPDGKHLAMGFNRMAPSSTNTTLRDILVWDLDSKTGALSGRKDYNVTQGDVGNIEFSPDSRFLYFSVSNGSTTSSAIGRIDIQAIPGDVAPFKTLTNYWDYADIIRTVRGTLLISRGSAISGTAPTPYALLELDNPNEVNQASLQFTDGIGTVASESHSYRTNFPRQTLFVQESLKLEHKSELNHWIASGEPNNLDLNISGARNVTFDNGAVGSPEIQETGFNVFEPTKNIAVAENEKGEVKFKFYSGTGLRGNYRNNETNAGPFNDHKSFIVPAINFIWNQETAPSTRFSMGFGGYIYVPADGTYTFYLKGSGEGSLDIQTEFNTIEFFGTLAPRGDAQAEATMTLTKGYHKIDIGYECFSDITNPGIILEWASDLIYRQDVPSENFREGYVRPELPVMLSGTAENVHVDNHSYIETFKDGPAIFARAPQNDTRYYLISGKEDYGDLGTIDYYILSTNGVGSVTEKRTLVIENGIPGSGDYLKFDFKRRKQYALAVLNDFNDARNNKLFVAVNRVQYIALYQFDITDDGISVGKLVKKYEDIRCDGCAVESYEQARMDLSEIQISPNGDELALGINVWKSNNQFAPPNMANRFELFGLDAQGNAYYKKTISFSGGTTAGVDDYSKNVLSFDYDPTGTYIYYLRQDCDDFSAPICTDGWRPAVVERINVVTSNSSPEFIGSKYLSYARAAVRRGKDKNIFINAVSFAPHQGANRVLQVLGNVSVSDVGNVLYLPDVNLHSAANGGLPLQPHTILKTAVKPQYTLTNASRAIRDRVYELTDHLGNVRAVVSDAKVLKQGRSKHMDETSYEGDDLEKFMITTDYSSKRVTDKVYTGNYALKFNAGENTDMAVFEVPVNVGDVVDVEAFTYWVSNTGIKGGYMHVTLYQENGTVGGDALAFMGRTEQTSSADDIPDSWQKAHRNFTIPDMGATSQMYMKIKPEVATDYAPTWFDDLKVTVTSGTDQPVLATDVHAMYDYYAFGMMMPGREYTGEHYRYGFNGMEKDDEMNSYNTHFREYDPRVGRWFSIDPEANRFGLSGFSPYHYGHNNPICFVDIKGDIPVPVITGLIGAVGGFAYGAIKYGFKNGNWKKVIATTLAGGAGGVALGLGPAGIAALGGSAAIGGANTTFLIGGSSILSAIASDLTEQSVNMALGSQEKFDKSGFEVNLVFSIPSTLLSPGPNAVEESIKSSIKQKIKNSLSKEISFQQKKEFLKISKKRIQNAAMERGYQISNKEARIEAERILNAAIEHKAWVIDYSYKVTDIGVQTGMVILNQANENEIKDYLKTKPDETK